MSIILHIESATKSCSVALSRNGKLIHFIEEHSNEYIHGEKLALFIDELMKCSQLSMKKLSAISISSGPGSYTGLRIGVSIAKGICFALSIPLISIETPIAYERCARILQPQKTICVMIDARRMEVYSMIFNRFGEILKPLSADILDDSSYSSFEPLYCVGDGCSKINELWSQRSVEIDDKIQLSATGQVELAFHKFQNKDFENVVYFEPNYLKEFHTGN